jgi:predicted RNase H-like nuclease (RuvC/YqgF family)
MKKYTIKPTKEQLRIIKSYWEKLQEILDENYSKISNLEEDLSKATKIKDLEFFQCDNEYVGVGNVYRTMKLIQRKELE